MAGPLVFVAAVVLALHGVVHLLGTAVYLELAEVAEFTYKTGLLGGRLEVGEAGARVFGVLWGVAALGFVASAGAVLAGWEHWRALVLAVAALSLALTVLDYTVAYAGVAVNLGILAALALSLWA